MDDRAERVARAEAAGASLDCARRGEALQAAVRFYQDDPIASPENVVAAAEKFLVFMQGAK